MSAIDKFMTLVMEKEEEGNLTPIIQHGEVTFIYIKYNNLYCILDTDVLNYRIQLQLNWQ